MHTRLVRVGLLIRRMMRQSAGQMGMQWSAATASRATSARVCSSLVPRPSSGPYLQHRAGGGRALGHGLELVAGILAGRRSTLQRAAALQRRRLALLQTAGKCTGVAACG